MRRVGRLRRAYRTLEPVERAGFRVRGGGGVDRLRREERAGQQAAPREIDRLVAGAAVDTEAVRRSVDDARFGPGLPAVERVKQGRAVGSPGQVELEGGQRDLLVVPGIDRDRGLTAWAGAQDRARVVQDDIDDLDLRGVTYGYASLVSPVHPLIPRRRGALIDLCVGRGAFGGEVGGKWG